MTAVRPYLVLSVAFGALVLLVVMLGTNLTVAIVLAVLIGIALTVVALRGAESIFEWVAPDHPDALGSLDVERITPPTP